jgi:8-oxo-dGTP diphosphatase
MPDRVMLTADVVVFSKRKNRLFVLLIKRRNIPFKGMYALPGGFVEKNEGFEDAALRELYEETNIKNVNIKRFGEYGKPGRDPRGRVVSTAFLCEDDLNKTEPKAGDDAVLVKWFPADNLPELAFDHRKIIEDALEYLDSQPTA